MKAKTYILSYLSTLLFYLAILFFIIGFNFTDTPTPFGWYQQFMPNINNRPISDITFTDSLTGFAVTPYTANDTAYILKTTNGGDNWNIVFKGSTNIINGFNKVQFINQNTGFCASGAGIFKTTNSGLNWALITNQVYARNMFVLNQDTIWTVDDDGLVGGVFLTTDSGVNWTRQLFLGSQNPSRIYMFNARIGFVSSTAGLYKTTNSGNTWFVASNDFSFSDMFLIDSLTGWKASGFMKKTTDGGLNWINQTLPSGNFIGNGAYGFLNNNYDTIWAIGESIITGGSPPTRGILYRTTNGGNTWYFQLPDTAIHINRYLFGKFINRLNGWAYYINSTGIHTITGGDTTFLSIHQISTEIPKDFKLRQNYPNPFNPTTSFKIQISKQANIKVIVYDITGKLIQTLVNQKLNAGEYNVDFNGTIFSSGVYFYSLFTDDNFIDTKKMILLK